MPELSRLAPILLALAGAAAGSVPAHPVATEPELIPARPIAPADHAVIAAEVDPLEVRLAWAIPREPMPVRFFVEVVAIGEGRPREVFAAYVDQPSVNIALAAGTANYAWRVYTVGRDVAAYALSGWERFSLRTAK